MVVICYEHVALAVPILVKQAQYACSKESLELQYIYGIVMAQAQELRPPHQPQLTVTYS